MKFLFDFFPILVFFVAFKMYDIYTATAMTIAASVIQLGIYWLQHQRFEKMHVITLGVIVVLGGATLLLHDEVFIKWKPTVVNWAFALALIVSHFTAKPLMRRMMEKSIDLSPSIWNRLNISWVFFFILMGSANLYVAYHFDTNAWVNFKLFGVLGLTIIFIILQALYLSRHITDNNQVTKP
ncbi:MAG: septation protein A [Gammaproteobacteria bacterium]